MEEIVLQNPGVVPTPKDSFGKRAAEFVFVRRRSITFIDRLELANLTTMDFLKKLRSDRRKIVLEWVTQGTNTSFETL